MENWIETFQRKFSNASIFDHPRSLSIIRIIVYIVKIIQISFFLVHFFPSAFQSFVQLNRKQRKRMERNNMMLLREKYCTRSVFFVVAFNTKWIQIYGIFHHLSFILHLLSFIRISHTSILLSCFSFCFRPIIYSTILSLVCVFELLFFQIHIKWKYIIMSSLHDAAPNDK